MRCRLWLKEILTGQYNAIFYGDITVCYQSQYDTFVCVYLILIYSTVFVSGCNEISGGLPILTTKCTLHV